MQKLKRFLDYFTFGEKILWLSSVFVITLFFCLFDRANFFNFFSSLVGISAILLNAKGNPLGQAIMVVFAIAYGIISWSYKYYGELVTYVFMTMPMSILSVISWFKNRYNGKKLEVKVNVVSKREIPFIVILTLLVTVAFYFLLGAVGNNNLIVSTLSVTTSFVAVYLTFRRCSLFAFFYALNDIVLIILWILATLENTAYISVVVCFATFLANDIYSFLSWQRMKKRQNSTEDNCHEKK